MVGEGIIREPTTDEKRDFTSLAGAGGRRIITPETRFKNELNKKQQEATKKHEPFFAKAATDDFKDYYDKEKKLNIRKFGYLIPEKIKPFEPDWNKYSNLENFELVEDGDKYDENLSKRYNMPVYVKKKVYKFKGYNDTIRIMEEPYDSIRRARQLLESPVTVKKEIKKK